MSQKDQLLSLKDDFKFPIPPANLTTGLFKSGSSVKDIYRTITTGLSGTPMPTYANSFDEDQRWALAYYIVSLSAFTDPLSGKPLQISEDDRQALNDPELEAPSSRRAFQGNHQVSANSNVKYAGEAWASKKGLENANQKNSSLDNPVMQQKEN